jgi:osmotically-inducible protein OsmY
LSDRRYPSEERGWWDRASDEVSAWFGDDDAERRREMDARHQGRGPKGYTRSDDRIREDVSDRLTDDPYVDASDIEIAVASAEVTLTGSVDSRNARRRAEDIAERVSGVTHVQNNLRVSSGAETVREERSDTKTGLFSKS